MVHKHALVLELFVAGLAEKGLAFCRGFRSHLLQSRLPAEETRILPFLFKLLLKLSLHLMEISERVGCPVELGQVLREFQQVVAVAESHSNLAVFGALDPNPLLQSGLHIHRDCEVNLLKHL